jgi:hypothetical protein
MRAAAGKRIKTYALGVGGCFGAALNPTFCWRVKSCKRAAEITAQIIGVGPQDMLTVLAVGIGLAAAAIAVLRLLRMTRR